MKFMSEIKDYIGWWILVIGAILVLNWSVELAKLGIIEETKRIQTMTVHCEKQGKSFLDDASITGMCV